MKAQQKKKSSPPPPHCVTHSTIIYIKYTLILTSVKRIKLSHTQTPTPSRPYIVVRS